MDFSHLQVRSGYSLMKSTIHISQLVEKAGELGYESLALTDDAVFHGAVPFYQACVAKGIKPILGMVVELEAERLPFILLAQSNQGYQQLLKLSTALQLEEAEATTIDQLAGFVKDVTGIIPVTKNHLESFSFEHLSGFFQRCQGLFRQEDFYLGIDSSVAESTDLQSWKRFSQTTGIPAVAVNDVRYLRAGDRNAYDVLLSMKKGEKWEPETKQEDTADFLKSKQELQDTFQFWPEALDKTGEIAAKCNVELQLDRRMLPSFPVPGEGSADEYLNKLCYDFLFDKYAHVSEQVKKRLDYELEVIHSMQFSDYFLIVWDFIRFAKQNGIMVGPGRGSAAGSLVAYVLGITEVDPVKYDLLFERFLNPERVSMPDIDVDFSDIRREEVIQYVKDKYGSDHVAQIITYGTFAARSLIRELIKTLQIDEQDAAFILKEIPHHTSQSISDIVRASEPIMNYARQSPKLQTLFKVASRLEGLPRHVSTHAAGIVISEEPLVHHVPLIAGHNGVALTQFAMKELETIGLLKMDFLGLRNLSLLERITDSIERKEKLEIDLEDIPLDDEAAFQLLRRGQTNGVFQLESKGMQSVLMDLQPTSFEDVVAVNALYRPGPMQYISVYVDRKHNRENVEYPHPDLKPILEKTYGVLVYQEQIMQIASKMAGFSLGQADILRRAVSKKQHGVMQEQEQAFLKGCLANGYDEKAARQIFDWIVRFSNYGFNRSHAVAYSMISYQLAYLKAHFPAHFMAEIMGAAAGQQEKIQLYINEAKQLGMKVLPPSINRSFGRFNVENSHIRMGMLSIKGVGGQAVKEIVQERKNNGPYKNLFDFCMRVSLKTVNRPVIESLILAGAFDESNANRASLLGTIDQAMEQAELFGEFGDQPSLFQNSLELDVTYKETEDFTDMQKLTFEKEVLGIYISSHPLAKYREQLRSAGYILLEDSRHFVGRSNLKAGAIVQELKKIRTKRGDPMAFMTMGDENGQMEAVIFPELYRQVNRWLKEESIILIKGKVEQRNERWQWLLSEIIPFDEEQLEVSGQRRLFLKIEEHNEEQALLQIQKVADAFPGSSPVIIYHAGRKKTYQLSSNYHMQINKQSLANLYRLLGKENVAVRK
ncbi:DNA polymerase III subunit alpha [Sediminibacillus dalangtanensis]|uniref:DNA polymerase III subunit alpha n=1 Tax=Sediminibacillus dalangtanensis TaxID=2729421 RepID=A0ABX7VX36_9BACI|nr:DNA polymerase III subunit alpha [Sediminibacillus dalangtanensis]QTN00064.1 DNA polymerase III subunit alpha [Sediminibacillus dalangtanensis]